MGARDRQRIKNSTQDRNALKMGTHSRWEIIIAKHHLIIVVVIVFWKQVLFAQIIVGIQDHWLSDLQWENVLVVICQLYLCKCWVIWKVFLHPNWPTWLEATLHSLALSLSHQGHKRQWQAALSQQRRLSSQCVRNSPCVPLHQELAWHSLLSWTLATIRCLLLVRPQKCKKTASRPCLQRPQFPL